MSKGTARSLAAAIAAQEQAVQDADRRLAGRIAAASNRMRTPRSPLRSFSLSVGSLAAAWFFLRLRRTFVSPARVARSGDRLSAFLNAVLPLLVPVVGVRAAAMLTALAAAPANTSSRLPAAAPLVDLHRYAGTWFEIGRMANGYERRCADNVTATFLPDDNGIRVVNRSRRSNGRLDVVRGRARVVDPVSRSKLEVTFAPLLLRWLPMAWGDYWILDVAPDYRYALVGTPDRRSLWVLSRTPSIPAADYDAMLLRAAAQGYNTRRMRITEHSLMR